MTVPNERTRALLAGRIEESSDSDVSPSGPVFSSSIESSYHSPIVYAADAKFSK